LKPVLVILKRRFLIGAHLYDGNASADAIREILDTDIRILDKSLDAHVLQSLAQFSQVYAGKHFESGITTTEAT
jgi:hypothetical protein